MEPFSDYTMIGTGDPDDSAGTVAGQAQLGWDLHPMVRPYTVKPIAIFPDRPGGRRPAEWAVQSAVAQSLARFSDFRGLGIGWNGPGSVPITDLAWQQASETIQTLVQERPEHAAQLLSGVRLVPLSSGGVHLLWNQRTWKFGIEISREGSDSRDFFGKDGSDGRGFVQGNLRNEKQFTDAVNYLATRLAAP